MTKPIPEYTDAFNRPIDLGDEVATITYTYREIKRGVIVQLGKNQVKIESNWRVHQHATLPGTYWIKCSNAIRTRTKDEIAREQN